MGWAGSIRFLLALAAAAAPLAARADTAERMELSVGETRVKAVLYRPSGDGPFPAIVAMHGCGGLVDRAGKDRPDYADWADRLTGAGFAVLFPDSYTSRGLGPQCTVQRRRIRPDRERQADAFAARGWLQSQKWVQADRVTLLGWSNGAVAAL
jgi:dienelactone hydrolase